MNFLESLYLKNHSIFEIIRESFLQKGNTFFNVSTVSEDCNQDMGLIIRSINESVSYNINGTIKINFNNSIMTNIVLPMIDSTGKIPIGILEGNLISNGLKIECQSIHANVPRRTRPIEGAYGRVFINIPENGTKYTGKCIPGKFFTWDICLPKSCQTHNDMLNVVRHFEILNNATKVSPVCDVGTFADNPKMNYKGYIVGILMFLFVTWSLLASGIDLFMVPDQKENNSSTKLNEFLKFFQTMSLYTNIKTIMKLPKKPVPPVNEDESETTFVRPEIISILPCIRTISIIWVMMGHSVALMLHVVVNPKEMFAYLEYYSTQYLPNAFFSVDSFFFTTGLLLSFGFFKKLKKNGGGILSIKTFIMMYVHRILRLSPSYYMTIAIYTWIFIPTVLNYMPFNMLPVYRDSDSCNEYWWANFLYINNYVNVKNQCYVISWYLATDLQIFLFSPVILIPLATNVKLGIFVSVLVLVLSTAANIFEVYHFYFPPTDFSYGWMDPRMKDHSDYTEFMYNAPWIRCQIYIIGMLVGYFLQMKESFKISFHLNMLGWFISLIIMVVDVISLKDWVSGKPMDLFPRAMYSAFSKVGWGVSLSFIVISCFYGQGGIINKFMSWPFWSPLGRITYSTYLIHFMTTLYIIGGLEGQFIFVGLWNTFVYIILPTIVLSFFFSLFWSAIFEVGVGKIEDLLIGRGDTIECDINSDEEDTMPLIQNEEEIIHEN
uniref:NRF domain-containing protein n=1 Tax=Strongyloides venezuelensis TaxID=75913 RepID=A0A0K0FNJ9_STRVS